MSGTIVSVLPDGRVVWRTDSGAELTALPESLVRLSAAHFGTRTILFSAAKRRNMNSRG